VEKVYSTPFAALELFTYNLYSRLADRIIASAPKQEEVVVKEAYWRVRKFTRWR
jgi:hypothetical protein